MAAGGSLAKNRGSASPSPPASAEPPSSCSITARTGLAVHPDEREPLVLVFDHGQHGLVVHGGLPQRVGEFVEAAGLVDLDVAGLPARTRACDDCGEVRHPDIVAPPGQTSRVPIAWRAA